MPLSILGFPTIILASIGDVIIDVVLSELHDYSADLTQNPVEDGTVFTDHVVLKPVILEMECRISDATQTAFSFRGPGTASDAFKALVELQKRRETFSVVTGLNVYQNMMFANLSIPRESLDGRSIRFDVVLQEILIVGDDAETNRARIADDVKYTALPSGSNGIVSKLSF